MRLTLGHKSPARICLVLVHAKHSTKRILRVIRHGRLTKGQYTITADTYTFAGTHAVTTTTLVTRR